MPDHRESGRDRVDSEARRWRSPIRGPWLTSVLGLVLVVGIPIEFVTGLLSYVAYNPRYGGANDPNPNHGFLGFFLFQWVTSPAWMYRLIIGVHVVLGLVLVPAVIVKLWSVMPKLFVRLRFESVAQALERASLILLVGGVVFQFATGILDVTYTNLPGLEFYTGHFYGAWLFIIGFVVHVAVKTRPMIRSLRSRSLRAELRTGVADTRPEPVDDPLVASDPDAPTISRRGVLGLVAGSSLAILVLTAGDTIGGWTRSLALLGPRYRTTGEGANKFQVNHTFAAAGIDPAQAGPAWRIELVGARRVELSRAQLLALPQVTADLPIACTEGWSTTQTWTGVSLARLAKLAGVERSASVVMITMEKGDGGITLSGAQVSDPHTMLALRVNGADLSRDHGYPARVMAPAIPGVYNRKWIQRLIFAEER